MEKYKEDFIKFLVKSNALKFGEFTLKSGRIAPYFINTGMFDDGKKIAELGKFYAAAVKEHFGRDFDAIYGPAYKGIPLCVTTAIALSDDGINKGYLFNRKKPKDYGQKDNLVGMKVSKDTKLILVDDVITSGAAIRESLEVLKSNSNPHVKGIIISVNRQEKGATDKNALKEVEEELGIPIFSIVTLSEVIEFVKTQKVGKKPVIDEDMKKKIKEYRATYGVD